MSIRKWHVDQAVHSTRAMMQVMDDLTLPEVEAALQLESETRRRKHVMRRLLGKAVRLNEQTYVAQLRKRYSL